MRRRLVLFLAVLALFCGLSVSPARAGWGYWEPSGCRADIEWMATSEGVWYWRWGWSESNGAKLVRWGYYESTYAGYGHECGFLGAPTTNKTYGGPNYWYQQFQGGLITSSS